MGGIDFELGSDDDDDDEDADVEMDDDELEDLFFELSDLSNL